MSNESRSNQPLTTCDRAKIKPDVNLISDALPFGRLWYAEPNAVSNAVDYAQFY